MIHVVATSCDTLHVNFEKTVHTILTKVNKVTWHFRRFLSLGKIVSPNTTKTSQAN